MVCIWYLFRSYFIAFVLVLWHETDRKQKLRVVVERQQCLFSCFPYCMLIQLSLILIHIWYTGFTFIHTFLLCSPFFGSLSGSYSALLFLCAQMHCSYIYEREFSQINQLSLCSTGTIKVLVILTIHVNALNFNYFHMQINITCSVYL